MAEAVVRWRGRKEVLLHFLTVTLPAVLSGKEPDPWGLTRAVLSRVVEAALKDVHENYLAKSRGDDGADGEPWAPLRDSTVERRVRRLGGRPGLPGERLSREQWRVAGLARQEIYEQEYRRLRQGGLPAKEARRQASITARFMARSVAAAAGRGLKGAPGQAGEKPELPILVETRRLEESAAPGQVTGAGLSQRYEPPTESEQRITYEGGGFRVDSDVPYGGFHMEEARTGTGNPPRPARPWKFEGEVPDAWLDRWAAVWAEAVAELVPQVVAKL